MDASKKLFETIQGEIGDCENVLFWSGNQNLLLSNDFKRLQLSSHYGTGENDVKSSKNSWLLWLQLAILLVLTIHKTLIAI